MTVIQAITVLGIYISGAFITYAVSSKRADNIMARYNGDDPDEMEFCQEILVGVLSILSFYGLFMLGIISLYKRRFKNFEI